MNPDDAMKRARYASIESLIELGRYGEAQAHANSALAQDPDDPDALLLLAMALLGVSDFARAADAAQRTIVARPDSSRAHRALASALSLTGRHAGARAAAEDGVRLAPHDWGAHLVLAQVAQAGRSPVPALNAAREAVRLAPGEAQAHFVLGSVLFDQNDRYGARIAYLRGLELDPSNGSALNNLAVLDDSKNIGQATRHFGAALRADPQEQAALANIDWAGRVFLQRVYLLGWIGLVVGVVNAAFHTGLDLEQSRPSDGGFVIAGALGLAAGSYMFVVTMSVPRHLRRYFIGRFRSSDLVGWAALAVGAITATAITCLLPGGAELGKMTIMLLGFVNWLLARSHVLDPPD